VNLILFVLSNVTLDPRSESIAVRSCIGKHRGCFEMYVTFSIYLSSSTSIHNCSELM